MAWNLLALEWTIGNHSWMLHLSLNCASFEDGGSKFCWLCCIHKGRPRWCQPLDCCFRRDVINWHIKVHPILLCNDLRHRQRRLHHKKVYSGPWNVMAQILIPKSSRGGRVHREINWCVVKFLLSGHDAVNTHWLISLAWVNCHWMFSAFLKLASRLHSLLSPELSNFLTPKCLQSWLVWHLKEEDKKWWDKTSEYTCQKNGTKTNLAFNSNKFSVMSHETGDLLWCTLWVLFV